MAKLQTTTSIDDIVAELEASEKMLDSGLVEEMLTAGAEEAVKVWRQVAEAHGYRDTGDMIESIGYEKPKHYGTSTEINVYPQGKGRRGVRNAEKAYHLHYGWSKRKGSHWVDEVIKESEAPVSAAMREVFEKKGK